jgi:predicted dehydrogenase
MATAEAGLPPDERVDFVSIATPNDTHAAIARTFIEAGFNVMCDKPLALSVADAEGLAEAVRRAGVVFAVTHNYSGYPLVRQARDMVRGGELGEVQAVRAGYLQGSLYRQKTPEQARRTAWKTDPERAGISGCFGDIGIHAYHLVRFITGLEAEAVACHLHVFFPGGRLDDYGTAALRFANGALGTVTASRVSHGRENDLWVEIDGTRGSLAWRQEEPNRLLYRANGRPHQVYTRDPAAGRAGAACQASCRLPAGHPEGFFEAFANVYTAAFADMIARATGGTWDEGRALYPTVADGVAGVHFVVQCVASAREGGSWKALHS